MNEKKFDSQREGMVMLFAQRGLNEPRLLEAMTCVPRHLFVPKIEHAWAYADGPLRIGHGQTISQPYIVALMTDVLKLSGDERVLDVGTGSGYQAAILAHLAREVHTIEFVPELAERAEKVIRKLGLDNVHCHVGDGSLGWPDAAPFDGILVAASAPDVPPPLLEQLAEGGRLILPVGGRGYQQLEIWKRQDGKPVCKTGVGVAFVPLRGEHGWRR